MTFPWPGTAKAQRRVHVSSKGKGPEGVGRWGRPLYNKLVCATNGRDLAMARYCQSMAPHARLDSAAGAEGREG